VDVLFFFMKFTLLSAFLSFSFPHRLYLYHIYLLRYPAELSKLPLLHISVLPRDTFGFILIHSPPIIFSSNIVFSAWIETFFPVVVSNSFPSFICNIYYHK
jgi:hypothetical protein